jgi:hypothetical protein
LVPTPNAGPRNIALGPDGNLWFTELEGHKIGKITSKGDIIEFPIPSERCGPHSIVAGPDGALWFTEYNLEKIGRITTKGEITEFPTPKHGEVGPGGPRCRRSQFDDLPGRDIEIGGMRYGESLGRRNETEKCSEWL